MPEICFSFFFFFSFPSPQNRTVHGGYRSTTGIIHTIYTKLKGIGAQRCDRSMPKISRNNFYELARERSCRSDGSMLLRFRTKLLQSFPEKGFGGSIGRRPRFHIKILFGTRLKGALGLFPRYLDTFFSTSFFKNLYKRVFCLCQILFPQKMLNNPSR